MRPRTVLPKVSQYIKNAGKSVGYAFADVTMDNLEGVKSFKETNDDIFREIYASVKNFRQNLERTKKSVSSSDVFQAGKEAIKNFKDDIKSGEWYNDRTNEYFEDDDEFGFDDYDISYGDDNSSSQSDVDDGGSVFNNTVTAKGISKAFKRSIDNSAKAQGKLNMRIGNAAIQTSINNTMMIMTGMTQMTNTLHSGIGAVYGGVANINKFMMGAMTNHLENSKKYYENSLKLLTEQNLMIKEMLDMQRNLYTRERNNSRATTSAFDKAFDYSGILDLSGYKEMIKKNFKSSDMGTLFDVGGSLKDMAGTSSSNPFMLLAAAPAKMVLGGLVSMLVGTNFKQALKEVDKTFTGVPSTILARLGSDNFKNSHYGFLPQILSDIFGIHIDKKKSIDTGKYQKGPVPFDGITRQAIIEEIPGYLARIEAALTGKGERYYNKDRGKWEDSRVVDERMRKQKSKEAYYANADLYDDLRKSIEDIKKINMKAGTDYDNSIYKMFNRLYDDGYFDPKQGYEYYGFKSDREFKLAISNMKRSNISQISYRNLKARQANNKKMEDLERSGHAIERLLYNGQIDSALPKGFTANIGLNAKDQDGHSIFWYLKNILSSIRKAGRIKPDATGGVRASRNRERATVPQGASSDTTGSDDDGEPPSSDETLDEYYARLAAQEAQEEIETERNKKSNKLKDRFKKTRLGQWLDSTNSGEGIVHLPFNILSKYIRKVDESIFNMIFGEKVYKNKNGEIVKTKDGEPITNILDYMIYKVDTSFDWLVSKFKDNILKPLKEKFIDPIIKPMWEGVKEFGRKAKDRIKSAFANTIGRGIQYIRNKTRRDDVATADGVEEAAAGGPTDDNDSGVVTSAHGRYVTKRGLTMISPGEMIIPASFDKGSQNKMLGAEKRDRSRILNAIGLNAEGTVDEDWVKSLFRDFYEKNKKKITKAGTGGMIGGIAGLLLGSPLLGIAAGAGLSLVKDTKRFKEIMFGNEEEGKKGIIPKKIQDFVTKNLKDMGDFGITGGILGLITPFGLLGGAAIGATIGVLKNSEGFKKFIFGDGADNEGVIKKDVFNKIKDKITKAVPNIGAGAIGGMLLGPFGFLGNLALGAGAGLFTTTNKFKELMLGKEDDDSENKGIVGAFKVGVIDQIKEATQGFAEKFKDYTQKYILDNMKRFWDPFQQAIKNTITGVGDRVTDFLDRMFERTIGMPAKDFLQEKIFKPLTSTIIRLVKIPLGIGKRAVAAPFRVLGAVGNSMRMGQIRRGTAYDMTAQERIDFRNQHKFRSSMGALLDRDENLEIDQRLANLTEDELNDLYIGAEARYGNARNLQKNLGTARDKAGKAISAFFNEKDDSGKIRYRKVKYDKVKQLAQVASTGDMNRVNNIIKSLNLTKEEKADLKNRIESLVGDVSTARNDYDRFNREGRTLAQSADRIFGRSINKKESRRIARMAKAELQNRARNAEPEPATTSENPATTEDILNMAEESPEQANVVATTALRDTLVSEADQTRTLITQIRDILNGMANPQTEEEGEEGESSETSSTEGSSSPHRVADAIANVARSNAQDEDSIEATEAREEEEHQQEVEEEETQQQTITNNKFDQLLDNLFGRARQRRDRERENGGGIFTKLLSGLGKVGKFLGIGGKVALVAGGVSLFGYATEWFKKSIWPKMNNALFGATNEDGTRTGGMLGGLKKLFLGEDGKSGILGKAGAWFQEKILTPLDNFLFKGGWVRALEDLMAKTVTGWGYTVNNVIAPLFSIIFRNAPKILIGLGKGILLGLKDAIFGSRNIGSRGEAAAFDLSSNATNEVKMQADVTQQGLSKLGTFGQKVSSMMVTSSLTDGSSGGDTDSVDMSDVSSGISGGSTSGGTSSSLIQDIFSKPTSVNDKKYGLLGSTKRTNTIQYDENGNIITVYTRNNKDKTLLSRIAEASGTAFLRGAAGLGNGNIVQTATKVGGAVKNFVSNHNAVGKVVNIGGKAIKGLGKIAEKIPGVGWVVKGAKKATNLAGKAVKAGSKAADSITSRAFNLGQKATSTVSAVSDLAEESGMKASEVIAEAATEGGGRISKLLNKVFGWIADSKVGSWLMKGFTTVTKKGGASELLKSAMEKVSQKIGDTLVGKAATSALGGIANALSNFSIIGIATLVTDFFYGYNNAYTIFGIAKGDRDYDLNFGQKCIAGLVNMATQKLTFGLIPAETILDIFLEFIAPLFGLDTQSLNEARERSQQILDEWNEAHPDEEYDNLEDYNDKDKWTSKLKKKVSGWWDSARSTVRGWFGKGRDDDDEEDVGSQGMSRDTDMAYAYTNSVFGNNSDYKYAMSAGGARTTTSSNMVSGSVDMVRQNILRGISNIDNYERTGTSIVQTDLSSIMSEKSSDDLFSSKFWETHGSSIANSDDTALTSLKESSELMYKLISAPLKVMGNISNRLKSDVYNMVSEGMKDKAKVDSQDSQAEQRVDSGNLTVFDDNYWKSASINESNPLSILVQLSSTMGKLMNSTFHIFNGIADTSNEALNKSSQTINTIKGNGGLISQLVANIGEVFNTSLLTNTTGSGRVGGARHIFQKDPRISNIRYGNSTIGTSGCGPIAATNLLNNVGMGSVSDAASYAINHGKAVNGGTDISYFNQYLGSKGISTTNTMNPDSVVNALKRGNQVVMLGRDRSNSISEPFGANPHFITATGIDSHGNIAVEDPDLPQGRRIFNKNRLLPSMSRAVIANTRSGRGRARKFRIGGMRVMPMNVSGGSSSSTSTSSNTTPLSDRELVLTIARSQIGVEEVGDNIVKYNDEYYAPKSYNGPDAPWCCAFVWWCFKHAGLEDVFGPKTASCDTFYTYHHSQGHDIPFEQAMPGDVCVFYHHIGIVSAAYDPSTKKIKTIEGNTNHDGSDRGYEVREQSRGNGGTFRAIMRPAYPGVTYNVDLEELANSLGEGGTNSLSSSVVTGVGNISGGYYQTTGSTTTTNGATSSTGMLFTEITNTAKAMLKSMYGGVYDAVYGGTSADTDPNQQQQGVSGLERISTGVTNFATSTLNKAKEMAANNSKFKYTGDNKLDVYNYLTSTLGLTPKAAAGIMGCWSCESDNNPYMLEGSQLKKSFPGKWTKMTLDQIYADPNLRNQYGRDLLLVAYGEPEVKDSYYGPDGSVYPGIGLAQWTGPRGQALNEFAKQAGVSPFTFSAQIPFFEEEFNKRNIKSSLNAATSVKDATNRFYAGFEMSQEYLNKHPNATAERIQNAEAYYMKYANGNSQVTSSTSNSGDTTTGSGRNTFIGSGVRGLRVGYGRDIDDSINYPMDGMINVGNTTISQTNYVSLLESIIGILTSIAGNTAVLNKILKVLSDNFGINIDASDIDVANRQNRVRADSALRELVRRSVNNTSGMSRLLNDKDTAYVINAMRELATE